MNSELVFEIIDKMKTELIAWDELSKDCDVARKTSSISTLEELESRLRERMINDESIICGCGLKIDSVEVYEKHKTFCVVANR